jgi:hypothetical protein
MKEEMMNSLQGLPEAAESNKDNGRKKAQKSQKRIALLVPLAPFCGHSNGSNFPDRWGSGRSGSVKLSQTVAVGQVAGQSACKCFNLNNLHRNQLSGGSKSIKVNQTSFK